MLLYSMISGRYNVVWAADGDEAIAAALSCSPDLVVSDLMLPRVSGLEMARGLQEDERTRNIPVLMITSRELDSKITSAFKAEANIRGSFNKSFGLQALKQTIVGLLPA